MTTDNLTQETKSLSKTVFVEVVYLDKMKPTTTKFQDYSEEEGNKMFLRVVNKFKQEKRNVLVNLRDHEHQLIKSELLK